MCDYQVLYLDFKGSTTVMQQRKDNIFFDNFIRISPSSINKFIDYCNSKVVSLKILKFISET